MKSTFMFYILLILSTMITVSSNNWISMWIGLELNMMMFMPLILNKVNNSSSEAAMIYFLTQSVSSMLLLMMVLMNMFDLTTQEMNNLLINISILIKLGAAPFHSWMPKIMTKMEWKKCCILMTWQKIAPLMMISNMNNNSNIINMSIITSIIIGSMGGINQTSLRKMMGYSSINHLGWLLAINKFMNMWIIYMMIYTMMMIMMTFLFNKYKIFYINQMSSINMNNIEKMSFFMTMLSMGGLPPLIGFLPKWIAIQSLIYENEITLIFIMIMFSLITLMYYLRVMTNMILSFNSSIKWTTNNYNKNSTMFIIIMNSMLPLILIMDLL
uniref:NADH-ubiquinone oxidoreductase chain 2 n=1 Tax=Catacanthus incarnatus TaxID=696896 RepID=A0A4D6X0B5_CATIN|nr:NADH dehydrogenase subunit 2 [Catacanthus incarnatus]QCI09287.1 NADH dehydrogenase subunit 2 [Catacanthus incarnatus]